MVGEEEGLPQTTSDVHCSGGDCARFRPGFGNQLCFSGCAERFGSRGNGRVRSPGLVSRYSGRVPLHEPWPEHQALRPLRLFTGTLLRYCLRGTMHPAGNQLGFSAGQGCRTVQRTCGDRLFRRRKARYHRERRVVFCNVYREDSK